MIVYLIHCIMRIYRSISSRSSLSYSTIAFSKFSSESRLCSWSSLIPEINPRKFPIEYVDNVYFSLPFPLTMFPHAFDLASFTSGILPVGPAGSRSVVRFLRSDLRQRDSVGRCEGDIRKMVMRRPRRKVQSTRGDICNINDLKLAL